MIFHCALTNYYTMLEDHKIYKRDKNVQNKGVWTKNISL